MINDRDDWLSPAAFVAGVDFEAKPPVAAHYIRFDENPAARQSQETEK
jgi:hypothetical protein